MNVSNTGEGRRRAHSRLTRRGLLAVAAGGVAATGLGGWSGVGRSRAARTELEEILIHTPRERCVAELVARRAAGMTCGQLAAAQLGVAMRTPSFHHVGFAVHAGLQAASWAARPEDPLYWCVDYLKSWQERLDDPDVPAPPPLKAVPDVGRAPELLEASLREMHGEGVSRALVSLARGAGEPAAWEALWRISSRDWTFVGHRAIAPSLLFRSARAAGGVDTESILRWLGPFQFYWYATGGEGQPWAENDARAGQHATRAAAAFGRSTDDGQATLELLQVLRRGKPEEACALGLQQLTHAQGVAHCVWDAVFLAALELLQRSTDPEALGQFPKHALTSAEALHDTATRTTDPRTRLLVTLQALAWMAEFTRAAEEDSTLVPARIDALGLDAPDAADVPGEGLGQGLGEGLGEGPGLAAILEGLGPRPGTPRKGPRAQRADQRAALPALFAWSRRHPHSQRARSAAVTGVLRSAGPDAHHLKLPIALIEIAQRIAPRWRAHAQASLIHAMPSPQAQATPFAERSGLA